MFCQKCGTKLEDGMAFCTACGNKVSGALSTQESNIPVKSLKKPAVNKESMGGKKMVIAIVAVIAVIGLLALVIGGKGSKSGGSSKSKGGYDSIEDVVGAYYTSAFNADWEGVVKTFPDEMQESIKKDIIAYREASARGEYNENAMYYNFINITDPEPYGYEIKENTELSQDELSYYSSLYDLKIEEGYSVDMTLTYSSMFIDEELKIKTPITNGFRASIKVGKIGKKWYVIEPCHYDYL